MRDLAGGETPFLHVYGSNTGAVQIYESLGVKVRKTVVLTILNRMCAAQPRAMKS